PIFNEDGTVATVFNGEIYNFLDLRDDLARRGHCFRSRTDSEVIVHAYEEYGPEFLSRLDGMFAIALWDGRTGRLLLARDRLGKKPLYYYAGADVFVFGSEIKALLAHPRVPGDPNLDVLPAYLVHGYVPLPATFYREIVQVPPASYVGVDTDGVRAPVPFWTLAFPSNGHESSLPLGEATEALRTLLRQAVRKRLISDVPLGALLSGGIDSSIVVSLMAEATQQPVRTFTAGFADDRAFDERPYARLVADRLGTVHAEFVANPNAAGLLEDLLWYHDQPYGDSSALPTFLVCGVTRQAVTVALVGDGGDEVFGGYERFRAALLAERLPRPAALVVGSALRRLPGVGGHYSTLTRLRRFGMGVAAPLARRYLEWVSVTPPRLASMLLGRNSGDDVAAVEAQAAAIMDELQDAHPLHRLMYFNLKTYLPGDLLVKMDRMSMAQSLETRSPFLDTAVIEFVASLPATFKIRGRQQKVILKQAFAEHLPQAIATRPKHGFGVPLDAWFRGALSARLKDELLAPDARIRSHVRPEVLHTLIEDHLADRDNHGHRLWTLLNLEVWLRLLPQWMRRVGRHG
ncbi:MAG: asparagine synthase (glutamine-hydrolyzing), partial [bacterium]